MGVFNNFPYANFHELNADWIIEQVRKVMDEWEEYKTDMDLWKLGVDDQLAEFQAWFDNLDVQDEIRVVMNELVASGEFLTITTPQINAAVEAWLAAHITPTTPAVDNTLSISGAAADAKVTGDRITDLKEDLNVGLDDLLIHKSIKNIIDNIKPADTDQYSGNVGQTIISVAANRYITSNTNIWNSSSTMACVLVRVPDDVYSIKITANVNYDNAVTFLTSNVITIGATPEFADRFNGVINVPANSSKKFVVPENGTFMYFLTTSSGNDVTPADIIFLTKPDYNACNLREKNVLLSAFENTIKSYITTRMIVYTAANERFTQWSSSANSKNLLMPVDNAKKIYLKASANSNAYFTFLKNNEITIGQQPSYASGYAHIMIINPDAELTVDVPEDAKYIYITLRGSNSVDYTPAILKTYITSEPVKKRATFCFVDDDAKADALAFLEQVVDATRIPINIALITGAVGASTFSTWDNLRRLQNKGFVFVNHTNTTVDLTTLTDAELTNTFEESQRLMAEHNMPNSNILVFPGGSTNDAVTAKVKNYFTAALSTQIRINLPPIETFYIPRIVIDTYNGDQQEYVDRLDAWKEWVDKTISVNGLCIFYGHAYHADYGSEKLADYIELVQYIAEQGCEILSLPEALNRYGNLVDGSVTIGCDAVK